MISTPEAESIEELFSNQKSVSNALNINGLKLKSNKTLATQTSAQVMGCNQQNGMISASKHKLSPLVSCEPPLTVRTMRSFIGSFMGLLYKVVQNI